MTICIAIQIQLLISRIDLFLVEMTISHIRNTILIVNIIWVVLTQFWVKYGQTQTLG